MADVSKDDFGKLKREVARLSAFHPVYRWVTPTEAVSSGGVPDGGATGEVLTKDSAADQDHSWQPGASVSYIDAGDTASVNTAASDATTKANNAESAAIAAAESKDVTRAATASSDATSKANAAQAAAETTASADATAKDVVVTDAFVAADVVVTNAYIAADVVVTNAGAADATAKDAVVTAAFIAADVVVTNNAASDATAKADSAQTDAEAYALALDKWDVNGTLTAPRTLTMSGHTLTFQTDTNNGVYFLSGGSALSKGTLIGLWGFQGGIFTGVSELNLVTSEPASPTSHSPYLNTATGTSSVTATSVVAKNLYRWDGFKWWPIVPKGGSIFYNSATGAKKEFDGSNWSEPAMRTVKTSTAPSDTSVIWRDSTDDDLPEYTYSAAHSEWLGKLEWVQVGYPLTRGTGLSDVDMRSAGGNDTRPYSPGGWIMPYNAKIVGARGLNEGTANGWTFKLTVWDKSADSPFVGSTAGTTFVHTGAVKAWEDMAWDKDVEAGDGVGCRLSGGSTSIVEPSVAIYYQRRPS